MKFENLVPCLFLASLAVCALILGAMVATVRSSGVRHQKPRQGDPADRAKHLCAAARWCDLPADCRLKR